MRVPYIPIIAVTLLLSSAASIAQEKQPLVTLDNEIEAARKLMATERKLVLAGELVLTPDEAKAFWPVYNEYRAAMHEVGDSRVKLITDLADNYQNMTDDFAEHLLREHLDIEERTLKVHRQYLKRFNKVLPKVKVAKLYQVESKLDALINYQLASQIPMIEAKTN